MGSSFESTLILRIPFFCDEPYCFVDSLGQLLTLFAKGIMCNIFVCLAVWIGTAGKTVVDKVVGILLPIAAFVACGFEHCVANMYFLPMGAVMHACGYGADVAGADALNVAGIAFNLSAATLGNIVGGAVLVALGYWFIYAKKSEA